MTASADVGPEEQREQWQREWGELTRLADESLPQALVKMDDLLERMLVARGYPVDTEEERASGGVYVPGDDSTDVLEDFFQARAMIRVLDGKWPPMGKALQKTFEAYEVLYTWLMSGS
ncbi:MAG: hypothetical protein JWQ48_2136 [Conexibacter sp.]|jgi:hypothetical protein|nr:hypothetical protein [Conexibacter sp.]